MQRIAKPLYMQLCISLLRFMSISTTPYKTMQDHTHADCKQTIHQSFVFSSLVQQTKHTATTFRLQPSCVRLEHFCFEAFSGSACACCAAGADCCGSCASRDQRGQALGWLERRPSKSVLLVSIFACGFVFESEQENMKLIVHNNCFNTKTNSRSLWLLGQILEVLICWKRPRQGKRNPNPFG